MSAQTARRLQHQPPFTGPTADRTLDSHLSHWPGWSIRARCACLECPPNRLVSVGDVLSARGDITVRDMARRMRCSVCGRSAATVAFVKQGAGGKVVHPVQGRAEL